MLVVLLLKFANFQDEHWILHPPTKVIYQYTHMQIIFLEMFESLLLVVSNGTIDLKLISQEILWWIYKLP